MGLFTYDDNTLHDMTGQLMMMIDDHMTDTNVHKQGQADKQQVLGYIYLFFHQKQTFKVYSLQHVSSINYSTNKITTVLFSKASQSATECQKWL